MLPMLCTVACYTFCSYADKFLISKEKISRNMFTFFISFFLLIFMLMYLPFDFYFQPNTSTFILLGAFTICKMLEFNLTAFTLTELSAFELKAWLGLGVVISYFYDIFFNNVDFSIVSAIFITMVVTGLFLIANDKSKKVNYKKIGFGLFGVIVGKSGYGIVIHEIKDTCSSTLTMCISLALICLIMLFYYNPIEDVKRNPKAIGKLSLIRVINTIGSLVENYVATISVISYSLIQPLILIVMFIISIFKKDKSSKKGMFGGVMCIIGIVALQLTRGS
ncbi:MAG: hypothetical protein ACI4WH_05405 [Oscillospiraceae bacterium]